MQCVEAHRGVVGIKGAVQHRLVQPLKHRVDAHGTLLGVKALQHLMGGRRGEGGGQGGRGERHTVRTNSTQEVHTTVPTPKPKLHRAHTATAPPLLHCPPPPSTVHPSPPSPHSSTWRRAEASGGVEAWIAACIRPCKCGYSVGQVTGKEHGCKNSWLWVRWGRGGRGDSESSRGGGSLPYYITPPHSIPPNPPLPYLDAGCLHLEEAGARGLLPSTEDDLAVRVEHRLAARGDLGGGERCMPRVHTVLPHVSPHLMHGVHSRLLHVNSHIIHTRRAPRQGARLPDKAHPPHLVHTPHTWFLMMAVSSPTKSLSRLKRLARKRRPSGRCRKAGLNEACSRGGAQT